MKNFIPLLFAGLAILTISCQNSQTNTSNSTSQGTDTIAVNDSTLFHDEHSSQNSLDWAGTYQDTIPCADCPGILTTIKLYDDGTYSYRAEYVERNTTLQDTGRFMWHNNGSVVHLKGKDIDTKYKVGENVLLQLDTEGKPIDGEIAENYSLHKVF
ncbi:MAG: copper resistance protein NlpE [Sphingobacterium composti]